MLGLVADLSLACGRLNVAYAPLVGIAADALTDESWAEEGIGSVEHWLVVHAGLSYARAGAVARPARRRDELPTIITALQQGRVSLDQAAVVARYTPAEYEASVAEVAENATVPSYGGR